MDEDDVGRARRYRIKRYRIVLFWGTTLFLTGLLTTVLAVFTPLRTLIPGYGTEELRRSARDNAVRVSALRDSMTVQQKHIKHLRQLITGRVDSVAQLPDVPTRPPQPETGSPADGPRPSAGTNRDDRAADNVPGGAFFDVPRSRDLAGITNRADHRARFDMPVPSPIEGGFPTRGLDREEGHYGVDIAVSEGTRVQAVGDGHVVLADWTREGGNTIVVQHGQGYLSVYKHNEQLLKDVGDPVQSQEAIAVSGNTGEMTTGPHVHFEMWRDGRVQDPRSYVVGW